MRYLFLFIIIILNINLKAQNFNANLLLYPNPTNDLVNIKFSDNFKPSETIRLTITDILGNKLKVLEFKKEDKLQFSILEMNFVAGIYFCKVETQNQVFIKRLFYRP